MERFQSSRLEKSPRPRPPRCKLKLCNRNSCASIHAGTYPAWPPIQIRSTESRRTALCVGTVCKRTSSRGNKSWRHAVAMAAAPGAADKRSARQAANRVDKTTFMPRTLCIVLPGGPATHMHDIDRWQVQVPIEPPEAVRGTNRLAARNRVSFDLATCVTRRPHQRKMSGEQLLGHGGNETRIHRMRDPFIEFYHLTRCKS